MHRTLVFFLTPLLWTGLHAQTVTHSAAKNAQAPAKTKFFRQALRNPKPSITSGNIAVVNAASFLDGISPGALVTIFGNNLSDVSGVVVANTNPLPYELAHVSVDVNGVPAPIFSVAYNGTEDQVSIQVPWGTATGRGTALVEVFDYGDSVGTAQTDSYDEDPGVFMYQGNYAVALLYPDYSLLGPRNAALPGDYVILYTTGLGPVSLDLQDGYVAPSSPLAHTEDPFQVFVDGEQCDVFFSGLAPGFAGLYQLNIRLPPDLPPGNLNLQIFSQFANSNVATLPLN